MIELLAASVALGGRPILRDIRFSAAPGDLVAPVAGFLDPG